MKKSQLILVIFCLQSLSLLFAQAENDSRFELLVGRKSYDVVLNEPVTILTPGGDQVEVLLRKKAVIPYNKFGISFNYHGGMKMTEELENGVATITMESTESPLVIVQVYSIPTTPEEVLQALENSFMEEYRSRNAQISPESGSPISQKFAGTERQGKILDFVLAGNHFQSEVYTFQKNKSVVAVVFQYDLDDAELAAAYFSTITRSLR